MSFWPPFQFQASLLRRLQRPRRDHGHNGTSADKISITRKSFDGTGHDNHRIWTVLVAVNGGSNVEKTLIDPLTDDEYQQFTNSRTKSSSHTEFRADILLDNKVRAGGNRTPLMGDYKACLTVPNIVRAPRTISTASRHS